MHQYRFGPILSDSGATFRLWAPKQGVVHLILDSGNPLEMTSTGEGWYSLEVKRVRLGQRYGFLLDNGLQVPDPASRFQPEDVHLASEIIDPDSYRWRCTDWRGRPWTESVIYEAHVGTFTEAGTFRAAIEHLDQLEALGVTALQLMPVADFRGRRGWGYDGVLPFAPESSYGRPDDLKALVDAAHIRDMSVFLDVVYNHLGPDGNYLPHYAPFFTERHVTPWGKGLNFDGDDAATVRSFIIENALYWVNEFRFDGLRLDAVHAISDDSERHVLREIAETVRAETAGRHVHLIVENDDNDADLIERSEYGKPIFYQAQWCDDIHHALHVAATGESRGYYVDYQGSRENVAKVLAEGFLYQGQTSPFQGKNRGKPSAHLPPTAFISFLQNHDQIGNRLLGDRLNETVPRERMRALAAIYLLAPQIPMIFMGEEWAASTRFPYFCDFDQVLNAAVREGRKKEFSHHADQLDAGVELPDPTSEETFNAAKLRWQEREGGAHAEMLLHYQQLLSLRRLHIGPLLEKMPSRPAEYREKEGLIEVRWFAGERTLILLANLGEKDCSFDMPSDAERVFGEGDQSSIIKPWTVFWFISSGERRLKGDQS